MGTRADFYIGRGTNAEWIGSVAWDGYPEGFEKSLFMHTDEAAFLQEVTEILESRDDGTKPEQGWPWPWNNSQTTDFAYAIDDGKVWATYYGHGWQEALKYNPELSEQVEAKVEFPDMSDIKNVVIGGKRSGTIVIGPNGVK